MPGEDQERFEDYLELERYIEALQEGRVAHPPSDLTPAQARIYRAAALFRSASPEAATPRPEFVEELFTRLLALDQEEAATPRPEFVEELQARLLALDHEDDDETTLKMPRVKKSEEPVEAAPPVEQETAVREEPVYPGEHMVAAQLAEMEAAAREERERSSEQEGAVPEVPVRTRTHKNEPRRASFFSRRSLLTGSAAAAASLVVGTGIGAMSEHAASTPPPAASHATTTPTPTALSSSPYQSPNPQMPLVQPGAGMWHFVGTLDEIRGIMKPFVTETIVGYVTLSDGDEGEQKNEIIAMSAACTHMGCIVQWQEADHQFHCPCHDGVFTEYGKPSPSGKMKYLAALPRMQTMLGDNNEVYVYVPKSPKKAT